MWLYSHTPFFLTVHLSIGVFSFFFFFFSGLFP